ncbi:hypothetical protein ABZ436_17895 [Micromonospora matsumotoense]|uniref:CG0192-related protein n=1 Tax=Micromonospora matsumotoense TaxID=121616 RepID=UPI003402A58F
MALLHRAEIRPSKLALLAAWLPGRQWYSGPADGEPALVAAYRFDDPAGEVGIETILVRVDAGPVHQVPLTYRDAPLAGADEWLVGTTRHSVLGPRWVYDACGDPVYAAALATAILTGTGQAQEYFETDGVREIREPSMTVAATGSPVAPVVGGLRQVRDGDPTHIGTDTVDLVVARRLPGDGSVGGLPDDGPAVATLTGRWPGQSTPMPLARVLPR